MKIKLYGQPVKTIRRSLKHLLVSLLIVFIGIHFIPKTYSIENPLPLVEVGSAEEIIIETPADPPILKIVTAYTLTENETDFTPCYGAYSDNLCELQKKGIQICATRKYPRGTNLKVGNILCVVLDKTSIKYANRIDILKPTKKDAYQFGRQVLVVEIQ